MRKLMWMTIGFSAACVVGVYMTAGNWLLLMGTFSLAASVPLFLLRTKRSRVVAVALFGCVLGFLWLWTYHRVYLDTVKAYDGETTCATVEISDYSYETSFGHAADGKIRLDGKTYSIRIYMVGDGSLQPGDKVTGTVRLRMTMEGGMQAATYHQGDGIFLLGYMDEEATVEVAEEVPTKFLPVTWRRSILNKIQQLFPTDTAAFAKALLLGEHQELTYEQDTAFKVSGIRHVVAVSGLHVSILFSLVYSVSARHRFLTALLGIPVLILFAAVAGFTPSVVRACVMQGLIVIALAADREYDPPTALAAAVLLLLLYNPITITSVSFQLSVGCMIGIFAFNKKIHDVILRGRRKALAKGKSPRAKLLRWMATTISVTLSAMVVTIPLTAWYFGAISIIGVVTNLLTLWVISFIFYGIMLAVGLGFLWPGVGSSVAWLVAWLMRYVLWISRILADFPLSAVYTASTYMILWFLFGYAAVAVYFWSKKIRLRVLACVLSISLVTALGASYIEPRLDDYRVTVFDVGQGQCILLQSQGTHYLVDCGGDNNRQAADLVSQTLLSQGVNTLDGIFLTHYDTDHAGGILPLLSQISVKTLYLPDAEDSGIIRETLTQQCRGKIKWITQTTEISGKGFKITLFPAENTSTDNENSLCLLFQRKNYDILITGDRTETGERLLLKQTQLPTLELLVIGHHGAKDSTGFALLEVTRPKAAVISVGQDNYFGHPSDQVLTKLALFGTDIYRTDQQGTIIFRG